MTGANDEKIRVLVADDEDTLRAVICEVLEDEGYEVTSASSGEAALEQFRKRHHPIVIADIVMDGMNGLQLLEKIKAIDSDTVVLIMTSHGSLDTATRALRAGAYDFMIKPFEALDVISATVSRAAEKVAMIWMNRRLTEDLIVKASDLNLANSALVKLADNLKDHADKDGLTGLYNHRLFWDSLIREINTAKSDKKPISIIFMDVDHFKQFNDTNGHLAGDEVLKRLANLARERIPEPGFVARYGGEELVALVPGMVKETAQELAESIRVAVESHPFPGRETQPLGRVTLSLGVATYPEDGEEPAILVAHADKAVYDAKDRGRNAVCG
jgi:diguanylate cyclase (GGDEF)-like protein